MLKSLFPKIDWEEIVVVGFDLDGTLYDEFDFISQVYRPISRKLASASGADENEVYKKLLQRWLEKGSSYNRIFSEALLDSGKDDALVNQVIDECVSLFRNFKPILSLNARTKVLLNAMASRYRLFLVTDGSCALQRAKFDALGLAQWFTPENIVISGCAGRDFEKPSTDILGKIGVLEDGSLRAKTVFFGDREVDRLFAEASGFQYVHVENMHNVRH